MATRCGRLHAVKPKLRDFLCVDKHADYPDRVLLIDPIVLLSGKRRLGAIRASDEATYLILQTVGSSYHERPSYHTV